MQYSQKTLPKELCRWFQMTNRYKSSRAPKDLMTLYKNQININSTIRYNSQDVQLFGENIRDQNCWYSYQKRSNFPPRGAQGPKHGVWLLYTQTTKRNKHPKHGIRCMVTVERMTLFNWQKMQMPNRYKALTKSENILWVMWDLCDDRPTKGICSLRIIAKYKSRKIISPFL